MKNISTKIIVPLACAVIAFGKPGPDVGSCAPHFSVSSGDDEVLSSETIRGKITVIIYLSRDAIGKNQELTNELLKFYNVQDDSTKCRIVRAGVVNSSDAVWPLTGIWKSRLIEQSKERGVPIYGDWDGAMLRDFDFIDKESNVIVIDCGGIVRYYDYGKIDGEGIAEIKELLVEILGGEGI